MQDFRNIVVNYNLGFLTASEFIGQWEECLRAHGLAFDSYIESRLQDTRDSFENQMRNLVAEIYNAQSWLAE